MTRTLRQGFKRKLLATAIVPAIGLWAVDVVRAADDTLTVAQAATQQQQQRSTGAGGTATQQQAGRDARASKLIGMDVLGANGKDLGEVNDLIIDPNSQTVRYAVLAFGGFLGLGEKLFAYPVQAFRFGPERDELVLNVPEERLKDAPGFERNRWPDWGRRDDPYRTQVERFHGEQTAQTAGPRLVRASEMLGQNLEDQRGENAGEIEDLVVNMNTGKVRYAVVDLATGWGLDDKLVPLPMQSFLFPAEEGREPVLNTTRERLDSTLAFDENQWPDINERTYRANVDRYLGGAPRGMAGPSGDVREGARDTGREIGEESREAGREMRQESREAGRELRQEGRELQQEMRE